MTECKNKLIRTKIRSYHRIDVNEKHYQPRCEKDYNHDGLIKSC